jgi:hypothetical protein
MKRIRIPIEFLVLGIVIIALLMYLLLRNPDRIQYQIPEIGSLSVDKIHKIELGFKGKTIDLELVDSRWLIQPQAYPTDEEKVKKIIDAVVQLHLTDVISESGNYVKYGLDPENRINVKVFDRNKPVRTFEIGKQAATYRHTFVKIENDKRVFNAKNSFRNNFEQTVDGLRNKSVMNFESGDIREITLTKGSSDITVTKTMEKVEIKPDKGLLKKPDSAISPSAENPPEEKEVWLTSGRVKAKKQEIDSLLGDLSDLKCQGYIAGKTKNDFLDPLFLITFKGGKTYTLSIFAKIEGKDDSYPALSSESPYPFFLAAYTAENFMKKIDEILPAADGK